MRNRNSWLQKALTIGAIHAAIIGALLTGLAEAPWAATAGNAAPAAPSFGGATGGQAMDLFADSITLAQKNGEFNAMVAVGNVEMRLEQGQRIFCDRLDYDPAQQKTFAKAEGKNRVRVKDQDTNAECGRLTYDMKTSQYILEDGAKIVRKDGTYITGERLTFTSSAGGTQMINDSSNSAARSQAGTTLSEQAQANIDKMLQTFPIEDGKARNLVWGSGQGAVMTFNTKKQGGESSAASQSTGNAITSQNVGQIPERGGAKSFEVEQ
ncbi:MAG: hypothetical protein NTW86_26095 [Candidatus Sumerlaeota bacterium]|nr:hypothetical protein [Candidatus Sumerlaeota bacterium]